MIKYIGKRGELRLYSGVTTNHTVASLPFMPVAFVNMNFAAPEGRARPDEVVALDRNNLNANAHWLPGSDEPIMTPIQISFTADLDDAVNTENLRLALSNPERLDPWAINGVSFANTNGQSQLINGNGSAISCPAPFDSQRDRITVQVLWEGDTPGTNDDGRVYSEVWFPPDQTQLTESETAVQIAATGMCHGPVSSVSAFGAGSSVLLGP